MEWTCKICANNAYREDDDGYVYCERCNSQDEGIIDTQINEEDLCKEGGIYQGSRFRVRPTTVTPVEPLSQIKLSQSLQFEFPPTMDEDNRVNEGDGVGPTGPTDFGSSQLGYEDYFTEIRLRYVMGIQMMIQMQCKALVENFDVSPQIVGLVGPIWLRFLASTRVMADEWADAVIFESETRNPGKEDDAKPTARRSGEPYNIYGKRAVMLWYRSLRSTIPLSYSLSISFLICHVAKEPILPTDILKGALEGKIPYFAAFVEIERQLGSPGTSCPFSSSLMFRPTQIISSQKLECIAAGIAQKIRMVLPPVNFNALAARYLQELSLPISKILPQALCIYEWLKPPGLYLSATELELPSRVRVMSILVVAIRMIYDLNGFGKWESSLSSEDRIQRDALSDTSSDNSVPGKKSKDAVELLLLLEAKHNELSELRNTFDHSKDLQLYLEYCKDVVFAGSEPSFDDHEEEKIIEDLWEYYQIGKGSNPSQDEGIKSREVGGMHKKRSRKDSRSVPKHKEQFSNYVSSSDISQEGDASHGDDPLQSSVRDKDNLRKCQLSASNYKDRALRELKRNMGENKFCYIPPRINVKKKEYLCYPRKKKEGSYLYAVHADYYILIRSCAKAAEVDIRTMHMGLLSFERRLQQLEERMNCCMRTKHPDDYCHICLDELERQAETGSQGSQDMSL